LKKSTYSKCKFFSEANPKIEYIRDGEPTVEASQIQEIVQEVENKPKSKKQRLSWIFLAINVVIVFGIFIYQLINGGVKPISEFFSYVVYYRFLTIALIMFLLCVVLETLKTFQLMRKCTNKSQLWLSYKTASLGRYWDCITPISTGGEPFQIYYLTKHGYSAGHAAGVPFAKSMFWQISTVLVGIIVLCTANISNDVIGTFVKVAAWIGILGNLLLLLFVLITSTNKKFGSRMIVGGLKLLHKLHIVKNYRASLRKTLNFIGKYQRCIKEFASSPWTIFSQLSLAILTSLAQWSISYFIYLAFNYNLFLQGGITLYSWWYIVSLAVVCDLAVSFIPLPGGSGAAEVSFLAIFATLVPDQTAFWALLFWRFFTYYSFIIQGFVLTFTDFISGKRKEKRISIEGVEDDR